MNITLLRFITTMTGIPSLKMAISSYEKTNIDQQGVMALPTPLSLSFATEIRSGDQHD